MRRRLLVLTAALSTVFSLGFASLPSARSGGGVGTSTRAALNSPGPETCVQCHQETVEAFKKTPHAHSGQGCAGCHGDATAHVEGGGDTSKIKRLKAMPAGEQSATCQQCHNSGQQVHFAGSAHDSRDVSCTTCHSAHSKKAVTKHQLVKPEFQLCTSCHLQKKAALMRSGHMPMREGKMTCSTCHNAHGTPYDKQLKQASANENCYSCHAEKRGPHLFEHPPVRENCMNCHDAHGSIHDYLLKVKQPLLCQQCHAGTRHPGQLHVMDRYSLNQGCMNCHPKIHGSNHPTGNTFWR